MFSVVLSGCNQKAPSEKNAEEKFLDKFVGIWKTSQSNIHGRSSQPPFYTYINDSITITFFSDRTLSWDIEQSSTEWNFTRSGKIDEKYKEYTYPGYYKSLGGKLVIILNGVTIYDYVFSNNSQNLTLTPLFDFPDLIKWHNNQTMNLTKSIDIIRYSTEKQSFDMNLLPKIYGIWTTRITDKADDGNYIDYYNDSILITFYPNGFFSGMINRTGASRWKDEPPSEWYHYNHTYPVTGYYEIRGKKLVLTASGVGIFYFVLTNNSRTLSLIPINTKNPTTKQFPVYYNSQTLILKKQSENIQQNFKEQSLEDKITNKFVGTWKASRVINESEYYGKKNYTIMFYSEQLFLLFFNSTYTIKQPYFTDNHSVIYHYYTSNNSQIYQGYYEVKAGKLVITTDCVNIFNFTFSNNSYTLMLKPFFQQPSLHSGFGEEIQTFTKN